MRGPVVVTVERVVAVPASVLWTRQVTIAEWTTWHPDVSWVGPGRLAHGAQFEWVWRGTRAQSRVTSYRPGTHLAWTTETASGASTMHWSLRSEVDKTAIVVRAQLDAGHVLARRPAAARAGLERSLVRWIDALAAPRYAAPPAPAAAHARA